MCLSGESESDDSNRSDSSPQFQLKNDPFFPSFHKPSDLSFSKFKPTHVHEKVNYNNNFMKIDLNFPPLHSFNNSISEIYSDQKSYLVQYSPIMNNEKSSLLNSPNFVKNDHSNQHLGSNSSKKENDINSIYKIKSHSSENANERIIENRTKNDAFENSGTFNKMKNAFDFPSILPLSSEKTHANNALNYNHEGNFVDKQNEKCTFVTPNVKKIKTCQTKESKILKAGNENNENTNKSDDKQIKQLNNLGTTNYNRLLSTNPDDNWYSVVDKTVNEFSQNYQTPSKSKKMNTATNFAFLLSKIDHSEQIITVEKKRKCNCKKNSCKLMYCECFINGEICGKLCKCSFCKNTDFSRKVRNSILENNDKNGRNKTRFLNEINPSHLETTQTNIACTCVKNSCKKKYCMCMKGGYFCSKNCQCTNCLNNGHIGRIFEVGKQSLSAKNYWLNSFENLLGKLIQYNRIFE